MIIMFRWAANVVIFAIAVSLLVNSTTVRHLIKHTVKSQICKVEVQS